MIAIHYFASIRESLGLAHEKVDLPDGVDTVATLIEFLVSKHGRNWHDVLSGPNVMVAVNHDMGDRNTDIVAGDEVAFFPPVTGG